jgi:hypothetical protein
MSFLWATLINFLCAFNHQEMKKLLLALIILPSLLKAQEISDSISMLPRNVLDVYYNIATGTKDTVRNNNWHIAFATRKAQPPFKTMQAASIRINEGNGVEVYKSSFTSSEWSDFDTAQWMSWPTFFNSDSSWDIGAFNQQRNLSNPFDYGWGQYDMTSRDVIGNKIWLLAISTSPNPAAPKTLKKLFISKIVYDTQWVFTIANINGTDSNTVTINKSDFNGKMHAYYNVFSKQVLNREPLMNSWDLLFTKYKTQVTLFGQTLMYPVMGILQNPNSQSAKIVAPGADTMRIGGPKDSLYFNTKITNIGWDWKLITTTPGPWPIRDSLAYFTKKANDGNYARIVFTGYWYDPSVQYIKFNTLKYRIIPIGTNEVNSIFNEVKIFPNPGTDYSRINFNLKQISEKVSLRITDLNGKSLLEETINPLSLSEGFDINLSSFKSGVYFITLVSNGSVYTAKLLVN